MSATMTVPVRSNEPDAHPRFVNALVEKLRDLAQAQDVPAGTARLRFARAGGCSRRMGFHAADLPAEHEVDAPGALVRWLHSVVRDEWRDALIDQYPSCEIRFTVPAVIDGLDAVGWADALIVAPNGQRTVIMLHPTGGFAYKRKVGDRHAPEGPDHSAIATGAMTAQALDADELVLAYIATEVISENAAASRNLDELTRVCAEWTYTREQYLPYSEPEEARMKGVLKLLDEEAMLPACKTTEPDFPVNALIVNQATGLWELWEPLASNPEKMGRAQHGFYWECDYCPFQRLCIEVGVPGRVSVEAARAAAARLYGGSPATAGAGS